MELELKPRYTVFSACYHERIDVETVEVFNVEENIVGQDVCIFRCPLCAPGGKHRSLVTRED